jgi:uncharacterized membrane protein YcaP (DUF421 family)
MRRTSASIVVGMAGGYIGTARHDEDVGNAAVWHDFAVFDLSDGLWHLGVPPLELVARSLLVYALFLAALRLSGKRELGQFTILDLAAVLLAANALQPAITGPDVSLPGAAIIVATLFLANRLVAWARTRSSVIRHLLDAPPTTIAANGAWIATALDHEGLDDDDLSAALRQHGLESVDEVKLAVLEHDGSISVVPRQGPAVRIHTHRRSSWVKPRNGA